MSTMSQHCLCSAISYFAIVFNYSLIKASWGLIHNPKSTQFISYSQNLLEPAHNRFVLEKIILQHHSKNGAGVKH